MTNRSDIEQTLDRYLAEGGEQVPDRVVDAALDQIAHTSQRLALRVPWRFPDMPYFLKSAMVGAAVIAVLIVGGVLLTRGPTTNNVGGPPAASSLPSVSVTDTSVWVPFVSERYGYTMSRPPAWTATGGSRDWEFDTDRIDFTTPAADRFHSDGYPILVTAFAVDVPSDMSDDEWINAYYEGSKVGSVECATLIDLQPISVDGHRGSVAENDACADAQAFVFIDGRVNVFAVWRADQEALLEAFLSTVEFEE